MNWKLEFWEWFELTEAEMRQRVISNDIDWLVSEVTPRVAELTPRDGRPSIGWEIGGPPAKKRKWEFSFSPIVKENMAITNDLVHDCPKFELWEIYAAKPRKPPHQRRVNIEDSLGELLSVSATDFGYTLFKYPDGKYDIDVYPLQPINTAIDTLERAVYHLIEAILGEEMLIRLALVIDVKEVDVGGGKQHSSLDVLLKHLEHLGEISN